MSPFEQSTNWGTEENTNKRWLVSVVPARFDAADSSWVKVSTLSLSELEASLSNSWRDFENGFIASWYFSRAKRLEPSRYCPCV